LSSAASSKPLPRAGELNRWAWTGPCCPAIPLVRLTQTNSLRSDRTPREWSCRLLLLRFPAPQCREDDNDQIGIVLGHYLRRLRQCPLFNYSSPWRPRRNRLRPRAWISGATVCTMGCFRRFGLEGIESSIICSDRRLLLYSFSGGGPEWRRIGTVLQQGD
jgi:hypothetical protein